MKSTGHVQYVSLRVSSKEHYKKTLYQLGFIAKVSIVFNGFER